MLSCQITAQSRKKIVEKINSPLKLLRNLLVLIPEFLWVFSLSEWDVRREYFFKKLKSRNKTCLQWKYAVKCGNAVSSNGNPKNTVLPKSLWKQTLLSDWAVSFAGCLYLVGFDRKFYNIYLILTWKRNWHSFDIVCTQIKVHCFL